MWLTKLICVPILTQMTVRVQCDAICLLFLDPRPSIEAGHRIRMTNGAVELDLRKGFHVIVANIVRLDHTLPKNTVIAYAQQNLLALTTPSHVTGK